jgi:hypothetical protein
MQVQQTPPLPFPIGKCFVVFNWKYSQHFNKILLVYLAWIVENSSPSFTGTYTLAKSGADTDTYTKFYIVSINSTHAELHLNYTFDFEVKYNVNIFLNTIIFFHIVHIVLQSPQLSVSLIIANSIMSLTSFPSSLLITCRYHLNFASLTF